MNLCCACHRYIHKRTILSTQVCRMNKIITLVPNSNRSSSWLYKVGWNNMSSLFSRCRVLKSVLLTNRINHTNFNSIRTIVVAKKYVIAEYFKGEPKRSDLTFVEQELPALKDGGKYTINYSKCTIIKQKFSLNAILIFISKNVNTVKNISHIAYFAYELKHNWQIRENTVIRIIILLLKNYNVDFFQ